MDAQNGTRRVLSGWKEIADYLGKSVRTVQRLELTAGLPIRRPAGKPRCSVIATTAEIDAWVQATPLREAFTLRRQATNTNALDSFRKVLKEHRQLRHDMVKLRSELRTAMVAMRETVCRTTSDNVRTVPERKGKQNTVLLFENQRRRA